MSFETWSATSHAKLTFIICLNVNENRQENVSYLMITHDEGRSLRHGNAEDEEEVEKSTGYNRVHHHLHPNYP